MDCCKLISKQYTTCVSVQSIYYILLSMVWFICRERHACQNVCHAQSIKVYCQITVKIPHKFISASTCHY